MSFIEIAGPADTAETKYEMNNIKTCAIMYFQKHFILMEVSSGHF